jgi:hypothetical protein
VRLCPVHRPGPHPNSDPPPLNLAEGSTVTVHPPLTVLIEPSQIPCDASPAGQGTYMSRVSSPPPLLRCCGVLCAKCAVWGTVCEMNQVDPDCTVQAQVAPKSAEEPQPQASLPPASSPLCRFPSRALTPISLIPACGYQQCGDAKVSTAEGPTLASPCRASPCPACVIHRAECSS